MKHEGRGVIRIGDKTDHGGQGTTVMGKLAALDAGRAWFEPAAELLCGIQEGMHMPTLRIGCSLEGAVARL